MKKEKIISVLNWILIFAIPAVVATADLKTKTITSTYEAKNLNTNLFKKAIEIKEKKESKNNTEVQNNEEELKQKSLVDQQTEEEKEKGKDLKNENTKETTKENKSVEEDKKEISVIKEEEKKITQSIDNYKGKVSYYRANCYGCGGYTSSGLDISDGRLYYNDSTYGNVRIVAAGKEIPLYSIVKLSNTSLGTINAIVLDRGGDIGTGRKFIIDILTNSKEAKGGVDYGVNVEVLRKGK